MNANLVKEGALSAIFDVLDVALSGVLKFAELVVSFFGSRAIDVLNNVISFFDGLGLDILATPLAILRVLVAAFNPDVTFVAFIVGPLVTVYLSLLFWHWIKGIFI